MIEARATWTKTKLDMIGKIVYEDLLDEGTKSKVPEDTGTWDALKGLYLWSGELVWTCPEKR